MVILTSLRPLITLICGHNQSLFDLIKGSFAAENVTLLLVTGLGLLFSLLFMLGLILWEWSFDKQGHNGSLLSLIWVSAHLPVPLMYQLSLFLGGLLLYFDITAVGHLPDFITLSLIHPVLFIVRVALSLFGARVQIVLLHF